MANRGFFSILVGVLLLAGAAEAKTVTKTASERIGIAVGGGVPIGNCYFAQTGANATETETVEGKVTNQDSNAFVQVVIYYTCGSGGYEEIFAASGGSNLVPGELRVSEDKRTAWLKKTMSVENDGYYYFVEIDIAVVANSEPWFSDNRNKSWNKSKSFQQTTHSESQYHSGEVFGTISIFGYNYFDNGGGYVFGEKSTSTVTNK